MRSKKQRKRTLKTFLITVLAVLVLVTFVKYKNEFSEILDNDKNNNEIIDNDNSSNKNDKNNEEKEDPYKDYKKLSYFKEENLNRYLSYKEKNPNFSYEKVVTYVNIGLDYEFYDYIKDADTSYGVTLLMNKYYKLGKDYEPEDLETISDEYFINGNAKVRKLRKEAKEAFEKLSKDSIENGTPVYGQSAYRPYSMQESLYNGYVSSYGKTQADLESARPGHSEHQTGLAIDVSSTKGGNMLSFDRTESFTWMQDNAHKYGFILRYDNDKTDITGYMYESWHYRYVGIDIATDIHDNYSDLTYEEYYVRFIEK